MIRYYDKLLIRGHFYPINNSGLPVDLATVHFYDKMALSMDGGFRFSSYERVIMEKEDGEYEYVYTPSEKPLFKK